MVKFITRWLELACDENVCNEQLVASSMLDFSQILTKQAVLNSVDSEFVAYLRQALKEKEGLESFCQACKDYQVVLLEYNHKGHKPFQSSFQSQVKRQ